MGKPSGSDFRHDSAFFAILKYNQIVIAQQIGNLYKRLYLQQKLLVSGKIRKLWSNFITLTDQNTYGHT